MREKREVEIEMERWGDREIERERRGGKDGNTDGSGGRGGETRNVLNRTHYNTIKLIN